VNDVNISTLISSKQDTLVAGTNITIVDNVISSSGGGGSDITQDDLDLKQDLIISSTNLTCNTINASSAIINSVDIGSGLISLQTQVDGKQPILNDVLMNEILAFKATFLNLHMNNGIFYYNGKTLDDLISAKQTIFTTGVVSYNNALNVYKAYIKGGASELALGNITLQVSLNAKHPLLSTTSDLSIRTLTATNIIKNGLNIDTLLNAKQNTLTAVKILLFLIML
jgi:hypothetical protein